MDYEVWENAWMDLIEKVMMEGYETLNEDERIWFNIRTLMDSIDDGGILGYFNDSNGDHIEETLEDLEKIGCDEVVRMLMSICGLFPDDKPSRDLEKRIEVMESWANEGQDFSDFFEAVDENFYVIEDELEESLEPIIQRLLDSGM